jgi:SAM-dependent methyltransferase
MITLDTVRRMLRCTACGLSNWQETSDGFRCASCEFRLYLDDGVLCLSAGHRDAVKDFYEFRGEPRFIDVTFESNPLIHCGTRQYRRRLDAWFARGDGALVDIGCGDGRMSLWALEKGFETVVAVDIGLGGLKRLAAEAKRRNLEGLLPVCAALQDPILQPAAFDVVLLFETLTYLSEEGGYRRGLELVRESLKQNGKAVVADLCRDGRVLIETIAMNVENMRKLAYENKRLEKAPTGDRAVEVKHLNPEELARECTAAGLSVLEKAGVSPIPMLFHFAYTFTSYPLRPKLDDEMRRLLETLDDQISGASSLARNSVLLLERAG